MKCFDLTGKVAIITGGNGGLGLGIAKGLASEGCAVALVGRNQEKIDKAVAEMKALGAKAIGVKADVSKEDDVNRMVAETVEQLGRVDILFNNAAISWGVAPEKLTIEDWDQFIAIDLTSCFLCSKAVYPEMVKVGGGKIVNIGSAITQKAMGKLVHYAAAKGGMDHMTQSLALAWGKDNIQVNAILPGLVHTEMMPCFGENKIGPVVDYITKKTPVGRYGMPDDFEGLSLVLSSEASKFITGSIIVADGGMTLGI
ncbi:MAG: SDR family oxidoreductase [Gammaproteobacteria bacterium]|nr:SDR family oxidoreductase [Gammaproteobacteria bacterium]MBQ0840225.1 SDR family oxidoreductase [Gammaproteobacteria bacterium]